MKLQHSFPIHSILQYLPFCLSGAEQGTKNRGTVNIVLFTVVFIIELLDNPLNLLVILKLNMFFLFFHFILKFFIFSNKLLPIVYFTAFYSVFYQISGGENRARLILASVRGDLGRNDLILGRILVILLAETLL